MLPLKYLSETGKLFGGTDRGPKPKNLKAEVTNNGPNRVCQRIFENSSTMKFILFWEENFSDLI